MSQTYSQRNDSTPLSAEDVATAPPRGTGTVVPTPRGPQGSPDLPGAPDSSTTRARAAERARLAALRRLGAEKALSEQDLHDIAALAATICGTDRAAVTLLDEDVVVVLAGHNIPDGTFIERSASVLHRLADAAGVLHVPNLHTDTILSGSTAAMGGAAFFLAAPIRNSDGHVLGAVAVLDAAPRAAEAVTSAQVLGLERLARIAESLLASRTRVVDLVALADRLAFDVEADPLTGQAGRAVVEPLLARLPVGTSVVLVDIDDLAGLNERRSSTAGDSALTAFASLLVEHCRRPGDLVVRWGGDEFLLILPACPITRAGQVVEGVRAAWDGTGASAGTTFSAGLTTSRLDEDAATVLARTDEALLGARAAGGNTSSVL